MRKLQLQFWYLQDLVILWSRNAVRNRICGEMWGPCLPLPPSSTVPDIRDLKIDDAADLDGAVFICMNKKSFLKCGNCNNRLKLILVTCVQFCLAKRCPICYKMDFQNTSHVVAFIAVAQGTL